MPPRSSLRRRYAPRGLRGNAGHSPGTDYDMTGTAAERRAFANRQVFVTVMFETAAAFRDLDAIAAMDGIDALTIGPADLAQDLGVFGTPDQARVLDELHGDSNKLGSPISLTERGTMIAGVGYTPNYHDALTGTQTDGRAFPPGEDKTCHNWTSSTQGVAMVGHIDRKGLRDDAASKSWNSSHPSRGPDGGCSQNDLRSTGGNGLLYCFAAN